MRKRISTSSVTRLIGRRATVLRKILSPRGREVAWPLCIERLEDRLVLSVFVVNSTADLPDSYLPDGFADTTNDPTTLPPTPASGIVTLRAAIEQANFNGDPSTILFNVGAGHVVIDTVGLPPIDVPITIDGTSQPGYAGKPIVELRGPGAGADGLETFGFGSIIKGLVVNSFGNAGIRLISNNSVVTNCYVGTDFTGTAAMGNGGSGIVIQGCSNDTIGGTNANDLNLCSSNVFLGIEVQGGGTNLIEGNFVGTDITGTLPMGNGKNPPGGTVSGIGLFSSTGNTIGGTVPGARNLVADNGNMGIQLQDSSGNFVRGNYVGTDITGMNALGNHVDGVHIHGGNHNVVGVDSTGAGANLISGNDLNGVRIHGDGTTLNFVQGNIIGLKIDGVGKLPNGANGVHIESRNEVGTTWETVISNTIGGTTDILRNLISGNTGDGVLISGQGAGFNVVEFNYIGTTSSGDVAAGNTGDGVGIDGGLDNTIGGSTAGTRNIIAGNGDNGVHISGATATFNNIYGNYIGLNKSGNALANSSDGVLIDLGAASNNIGTTGDGGRNVISANQDNGISIRDAETTANSIRNNYIGTDVTGLSALANGGDGISIFNSPGNFIGGANEATKRLVEGNLISGNTTDGVHIEGSTASGNRVRGNFIGVKLDNTAALANGKDGVFITGAPDNIVGSSNDESRDFRNVISGNIGNGVFITGAAASGTFIQGNFIGTDINGTLQLGNHLDGVLITDAPTTTIGSRNTSPDSVISGNAKNGVEILNATATDTKITLIKIGVDFAGNPMGNVLDGVKIDGAPNATVKNCIISSNLMNGVHILGAGATGNKFQSNSIGVSDDGTEDRGNHQNGVLIEGGATGNFIGNETTHNTISANTFNGVKITGDGTNGNFVLGNLIGTNTGAIAALANGQDGVLIAAGAANNTVGGAANLPGQGPGNVISGNTANGVEITGAGTNINLIEANVIGAQGTGAGALANGNDGVLIAAGAANNTIGGIGFGLNNIISGNSVNGIEVTGNNTNLNLVQNNSIGVDTNGVALPNGHDGVLIAAGAANNTIGALGAGLNNIISGNTANGVELNGNQTAGNTIQNNYIGVDGGALAALPNGNDGVLIANGASRNFIGTVGGGNNVISGNTVNGVELSGNLTTGNTVTNNYIGVDVNATAAIANGGEGVFITTAAFANEIGDANSTNIISGNAKDGIKIMGAGTTLNKVLGNNIGTDIAGNLAIPNTLDGVFITGGAANNNIGGVNPGEDNLISGNGVNGVHLFGAGTAGNTLSHNTIGANLAGLAALPNVADGVLIDGAPGNFIGTAVADGDNLISGNGANGVHLLNAGATGNTLSNNTIGANLAGLAAIPNVADGVLIDGAPANFVGTAVASGGNLISGNGGNGVHILNAGATGNLVKNNFIGCDTTHVAALANTASGVLVDKASRNTIGGAPPADNLIAFNGTNGVTIVAGTATGNQITKNAIFANTALGIDLGNDGVTLNTPGGPHAGPNRLQNFPVVSAIAIGSSAKVTLTLDSTPNSTFTVELFNNPVAGAGGFGQGKIFLTSATIITNATGHGSVPLTVPGLGAGQILTATATNTTTNDTSEFSNAAVVTVPIPPKITDLNFVSTATAITGVVFKFSHALNAASAQLAKNFGLFTAGADKVFGTADDAPIRISKVVYNNTAKTVTLTTRSPLAKNQFVEAFAGGTLGKAAVLDAAGVQLDGEFTNTLPSGDGAAGGDFRAIMATGTTFTYNDAGGDKVALSLARGGTMTLLRTLDGEGRYLRLTGTIARKSILSGSVKPGQPAPPADGVTTLQSVTGLKGAINRLPASFVLAHPAS